VKIALPVENNMADSNISPSFGRAPYFLIYDSDTDESIYVNNTAAASQGGAGIKAAQAVIDLGAQALITPRCGENAAQVIKIAGIEMYKSQGLSAAANIAAYKANTLSPLDDIHPGFHNHGNK